MEIITSQNGVSVNGAPLTTSATRTAAPGLLRNAIDDRIVRIRPMATPIDQLSRCGGARPCSAMKVDYYSVDVKAVSANLTEALSDETLIATDNDDVCFTLKTDNNGIFSPTETLLVPSAKTADGSPVMMYVERVDRATGVRVRLVNVGFNESGELDMDPIPVGAKVVRMGRAATELDVQTSQFEALPKKAQNYCQIFKMQVAQSTFQKLANKEVGWNFSDQEEVAVIDMRQGMEKNFLFGNKAIITDHDKNEEVYLTGGIWNQTPKTFTYKPSAMAQGTLADRCRKAFTGEGSGSAKKILIGGSGLIEALSKVSFDKAVQAGETFVKWGIEFREIRTNFGCLYVLLSEIFDQCGHENDGFILDPDCLTKYVHVPFHTETLDLRRSGVRNTDAIVLTEASCLVLRHPESHMKVVAAV